MHDLESFSSVENNVDEKKYMHQSAGVTEEVKKKLHVPKRKAKPRGNVTWQKKQPRHEQEYDEGPIQGNYVDEVRQE